MTILMHAPGSCSEGMTLLLKTIGAPHEVRPVNLKEGEQNAPAFRALNPKGKVPALVREDGSVRTEFGAIAFWLARAHPQAGVLPEGEEAEARALELIEFIVGSIHMRGFTFMRVPGKFIADPAGQEALRAHGRAEFEKGLARLAEALGERDFLLGERFSIADAAAWYVLRWAVQEGVALPGGLSALHDRLAAMA